MNFLFTKQYIIRGLVLFCFAFPLPLVGQGKLNEANKQQPDRSQEWMTKYLTVSDSLEYYIAHLRDRADTAHGLGHILQAIKYIQIALVLEKKLAAPTKESFSLNMFAADLIFPMDPRYALQFLDKACDMIPVTKGIVPAAVFIAYTNRAGMHSRLMEYDSALYYFRKAIVAGTKDNPISVVSSYNNLGVFFFERLQNDSAKVYFRTALDLLIEPHKEISLYCAIRDNLAQLDLRNGVYEPAFETFTYNDSVYFHRELANKYVINKVRLMGVMEKLGKPGIGSEIENLNQYIAAHRLNVQGKEVVHFLRFAIDYYYSTGKYEASKRVQEKHIHWTDSLRVAGTEQLHLLTQSFLVAEEAGFQSELQAHELKAEKTAIQLRATKRTLLISLFSAGVIVASLILYFRMRRKQLYAQKRIAEAELRHTEMEARLIEQELILKKKDMTNLVLHNTQVYDANQKMIGRLQSLSQRKENLDQHIRALLIELQSQNQVGERSILLQSSIDEVNEAFYEKLRTRFPDLTKAEVELCGYLRINLSTKDIAILKNVEAGSVKMGKNRLRKKLGVRADGDIYGFVREV